MAILLYDLVGKDKQAPFSPHCWKAAMALAHKGLEFRSIPTGFTEIDGIAEGPRRVLPTIRDGERLISDSFEIALYLEATCPDAPSLFHGEGGRAAARFVERWAVAALHPYVGRAILMDLFDRLHPADQAYFRETREKRYGKRLEAVPDGREDGLAAFRAALEPLRATLSFQPFLGGDGPLFADYIVFGTFQWARVSSPFRLLEAGDPVAEWFERCLDLHGGLGRRVAAAA